MRYTWPAAITAVVFCASVIVLRTSRSQTTHVQPLQLSTQPWPRTSASDQRRQASGRTNGARPAVKQQQRQPGATASAPAAGNRSGPSPTGFVVGHYDVIWNGFETSSPKKPPHMAMPVGNGDVALSVWPNRTSGGVSMYVAKQDAWGECGVLMQVALITVWLSPSPYEAGPYFQQRLDLQAATIRMRLGGRSAGDYALALDVWVDANRNTAYVEMQRGPGEAAGRPRTVSLELMPMKHGMPPPVCLDFMCEYTDDVVVDPVPRSLPRHALLQYHRVSDKDGTVFFWNETFGQQGLRGVSPPSDVRDTVSGTQFGVAVVPSTLARRNRTHLSGPLRGSETVHIHVMTAQVPDPEDWLARMARQVAAAPSAVSARPPHDGWWALFWRRSHIEVTLNAAVYAEVARSRNENDTAQRRGDPEALVDWLPAYPETQAFTVTQQYALQRYLQATNCRGAYPMRFNGMLYNAQPPAKADHRAWGDFMWWFNTRLPYQNMLPSGDADLSESLFGFYRRVLPMLRLRAKALYNFTGALIVLETTSYVGGNPDFGCAPDSRRIKALTRPSALPKNVSTNLYTRFHYTQALDLSTMILDHWYYTRNATALALWLPLVTGTVQFFSLNFPRKEGRLWLYPSQVLETYQCTKKGRCCLNPVTDVAGLQRVLQQLHHLPPRFTTAAQRQDWLQLLTQIPPLPLGPKGVMAGHAHHQSKAWAYSRRRGLQAFEPWSAPALEDGTPAPRGYGEGLLPAHAYGKSRNTQNVALYAVHPFRLFGPGKPNVSVATGTFRARPHPCNVGWCLDVIHAAFLGLPHAAARLVLGRAHAPTAKYRFPAFHKKYQDHDPNSAHLSVMNTALQAMLLQPLDDPPRDRLLLLGAWPCAAWDVAFRLHGPRETVVQGRVVGGRLVELEVTPPERRRDVLVHCACGGCADAESPAEMLELGHGARAGPWVGAGV